MVDSLGQMAGMVFQTGPRKEGCGRGKDTDEEVRHKMYPIKRPRQDWHLSFGGIGMEVNWQSFWLRHFKGGITWQDIYHQEFMWRSTNQGQSPWKA